MGGGGGRDGIAHPLRVDRRWKDEAWVSRFLSLGSPTVGLLIGKTVHLFPTNLGQSAYNSVKVQPISTLRLPNHARPAAELPNRRTAEIACTISEMHALSPILAGKRCICEIYVMVLENAWSSLSPIGMLLELA